MCSQDAVRGQKINDLITNRKEKIHLEFSEDCLYLNIYTPANLTRSSRLPVMVWIHGGGLTFGGASTYDGLALSAHENVVVVAIQYRLSIWGFFSNWYHSTAPEHYAFPDREVGVLSPLAKNLFHRAISESGVIFVPSLFTKNPRTATEKVAVTAGCKTTTSAVIVHCLRQKTEDELLEVMQKMDHAFVPTVLDGVLLPKAPEEILAEKNFNTVPYIVGINKQEFGWLLPTVSINRPLRQMLLHPPTTMSPLYTSLNSVLKPYLGMNEDVVPVAIEKYVRGSNEPLKIRDGVLELLGDLTFGVPSVIVSRGHRDGASEEETNLSKMMMKFWANFARNGNPNGEGLPHWPEYDQKEGYLQIGATTQQTQRLKGEEVAFWTEILAKKHPKPEHNEL
ncbi:Liver carboxylesterase 4 [Cricetulus griseus]|uniref:Liver carboxylesterase 4 n=1 Tax=Cricetulus griseus TaxID=10029 RepID=G3I5L0_CRIGR|nr:Liver carboxylesterase 4 [Cricetulus griseus]